MNQYFCHYVTTNAILLHTFPVSLPAVSMLSKWSAYEIKVTQQTCVHSCLLMLCELTVNMSHPLLSQNDHGGYRLFISQANWVLNRCNYDAKHFN